MASCPRCGKPRIKKRRDGLRKCARCGTLPNRRHLNRAGKPEAYVYRAVQHVVASK